MKLFINVYDKGQCVALHRSREAADNAACDEISDDREECIETTLAQIRTAPKLISHLKALAHYFDGLEGPFSDHKRDILDLIKAAEAE